MFCKEHDKWGIPHLGAASPIQKKNKNNIPEGSDDCNPKMYNSAFFGHFHNSREEDFPLCGNFDKKPTNTRQTPGFPNFFHGILIISTKFPPSLSLCGNRLSFTGGHFRRTTIGLSIFPNGCFMVTDVYLYDISPNYVKNTKISNISCILVYSPVKIQFCNRPLEKDKSCQFRRTGRI